MSNIQAEEIRGQRWKFYFGLIAWPLYLLFIPWIFSRLGWSSLVFMVFPGLLLFSWTGYLMHECWHRYVPGLPHDQLFTLYAWMLVTDPQIYRMLHGQHHSQVNTYDDREFHPLGEIRSRFGRSAYHAGEIFLGMVFVMVVAEWVIPFLEKYRSKFRIFTLLNAVMAWIVFMGGMGWLSTVIFGLAAAQVVIPYAITLYLGSLLVHHSQLVEHGNLIVAGSWDERNVKTRNLRHRTWLEKVFLFLTHWDSQEHVLHHTQTRIYTRPFPGRLPMPENAVTISLGEYGRILAAMLAGRPSER